MSQEIKGYDLTTKSRVLELADNTHYPVFMNGGAVNGGADAFGRQRTSNPTNIFASSFEYDLQPLLFEQAVVTGGSLVHGNSDTPTNKTCAVLKTDGTANASITLTQIGVNHYQPGKSQLILITFVLGAAVTEVRRRVGYFDANDGCFLEQSSGVLKIIMRTSVDGSTGDTPYAQTAWNIDTMDGTGGASNPSGILLNVEKQQIFFIQAQWLGAGKLVFGFDIDGVLIPVHHVNNANENGNSTPYMRTFNLPVRWEQTHTAEGDAASFKAICCAVDSEGGLTEEAGFDFSASNGVTAIGVTTRRAILTIKPATTFNSIANNIKYELRKLEITCKTNDGFWELIYDAALGGTPSFGAVNASSGMSRDVAGTTITGGIVVDSGYITAGTGASRTSMSKAITSKYPLALSAAGVQHSFTVAVTSFTGTCDAQASLTWKEVR